MRSRGHVKDRTQAVNDGARLKSWGVADVTFVGGLYEHLIVLVPRPYDFGRLLYFEAISAAE